MDQSLVKDLRQVIEEGIVKNVDGINYSPRTLVPIRDGALVVPLQITTLTGLCDYLKGAEDGFEKSKIMIVIKNERNVYVVSSLNRPTKTRDEYVNTTMPGDYDKFPFNQFLDHEDFIIKLKSLFVETDDQQTILKYVSSLTVKGSVETLDDGISQSATVKRGISGAILENRTAPSIVKLAPYRTFREIVQPVSQFLFRMRTPRGENSTPECALFEADGGGWRHEAIKCIKQYLMENVPQITILS